MDNEILKITELVKDKTDKEVVVVKAGEGKDRPEGFIPFRRGGTEYLCKIEEPCDEGLKAFLSETFPSVKTMRLKA